MKHPYLIEGRLSDILALIQVLALDEHTHRSEDGLAKELRGKPRSATTWGELAADHPEFFRFNPATNRDHPVSPIARHVVQKDGTGNRPFPIEYTSKLLDLAVELHDREVKRAQVWHIWLPVLAAVIVGLLTLLGVWAKREVT